MPDGGSPIAAARFGISIDGVQIGWFDELVIGEDGSSPARGVRPHELAHVVQQQVRKRPGRTTYPSITLKRGYISQSAVLGLKEPIGRRFSIAAPSPAAQLTLVRARLERGRGLAEGPDIAMEELVLAHEGFG